MKGKSKTQKGITLIALIITIVVLLILAVVAIDAIQDDGGILAHAQNAAGTYNNAVANEQAALDKYLEYLTGANGGFDEYSIGDEVTIGTEYFYVIKDSGTTESEVILLAQYPIIDPMNLENLVQATSKLDDIKNIRYASTNYWSDDFTSHPYDLVQTGIPDTNPDHYAAYAAYKYGEKLGGIGRLMSYNEAKVLEENDSTNNILRLVVDIGDYRKDIGWWLGSACTSEFLWAVEDYGLVGAAWEYAVDVDLGLRPVIEISKSKVALVTE